MLSKFMDQVRMEFVNLHKAVEQSNTAVAQLKQEVEDITLGDMLMPEVPEAGEIPDGDKRRRLTIGTHAGGKASSGPPDP